MTALAVRKGMTRYQRELDALGGSYGIARHWDVSSLARVLERGARQPLLAVGSGGSFSLATYCAGLHWHATGNVARAVTPLMLANMEQGGGYGLLCVSASGRNLDIRGALRQGVQLELRPAISFTLDGGSPLHQLAEELGYPDAVAGPEPAEPDGFLAVNSILVTGLLFARAYRAVAGEADMFPESYAGFLDIAMPGQALSDIADKIAALGGGRTLSVLYSATLEAAAVDLESRFVEAALGHLHAADFRNFGHGRHNWMAKRGARSAVLALASEDDAGLVDRTLKVLPEAIPVVRVDFGGASDVAGLAGLVAALHVAGGMGEAIGTDPGRPGIPEFGRKLFRLAPPKRSPAGQVVLERKRVAIERTGAKVKADVLKAACAANLAALEAARIQGVVLDYDGTLCDARRRFDPLPHDVSAVLERLIELGLRVGIVTGRGRSVGQSLREVLPKDVWEWVRVGYYNGGECAPLADGDAPHKREAGEITRAIAAALSGYEAGWLIEARASQVTVTPTRMADMAWVVAGIQTMLARLGPVRLVTSNHSVDILLPGVSKTRLVEEFEREFGMKGDAILRIGDRGAPPGNDADLLHHPLGLSVDEVSADLKSCWRWSPAGYFGPRATLYYLNGLTATAQGVRWRAAWGGGDNELIHER